MPEPIFYRIRDEFAPGSNSEMHEALPTWALSYLKIVVRRQQPAANSDLTVRDLVSFISRIAVYVRGATVFDLDGEAAFMTGAFLYCKSVPFLKRALNNANSQHFATIYVPFSRKPLMPTSGIKPVARGESVLYMRFGTVPTNTAMSIYAVGWRDNAPDWTVRCTRYSQNITTTGPNDLILAPVGPILGFIFNESNPKETATTTLMSELRFLIQGVEDTLISYDLNALTSDRALTTMIPTDTEEHAHIENLAGAYTQNATTTSRTLSAAELTRYFPLLLDELYDPDAVIAVAPGVDVRLRTVATGTGTLNVILVEMFTIPEPRPT
ncbi:hypothetical protein [Desulfurococcus sp.]|uniref:hypothetical protein n=1 Tax=Desulfurococcus sp. TaxID=51678 RepID=UPI0031733DF2